MTLSSFEAKFSLLCKTVSIVLKVRAASIEISGNVKRLGPVNMAGGVKGPIVMKKDNCLWVYSGGFPSTPCSVLSTVVPNAAPLLSHQIHTKYFFPRFCSVFMCIAPWFRCLRLAWVYPWFSAFWIVDVDHRLITYHNSMKKKILFYLYSSVSLLSFFMSSKEGTLILTVDNVM